ncbi:tyrosine-type recombinase/integrase [Candidatus Aerophobetes bacterium]|nr:tyrosine-type recombinase/integrase [Candidatus Aerophobetes bacterium]
MNIDDAFKTYFTGYMIGKSIKTEKTYYSILSKFVSFLKKKNKYNLEDITHIDVDIFISENYDRKSTIVTVLQVLKSFLQYFLSEVPSLSAVIEHIRKQKSTMSRYVGMPEPVKLKPEDLERMMKYIDKLDYVVAFRLMAFCGLRIGEVRKLKVSDINFEDKSIVIHGKGGKIREVPIDDETLEVLKFFIKYRRLKPDDNIYNMTDRAFQKNIKKWAKKAGIPNPEKIFPHKLRKFFGKTWLRGGGTPFGLAQIYGHSKVETTMRYVGMDIEEIKEKYDKTIRPIAEKVR